MSSASTPEVGERDGTMLTGRQLKAARSLLGIPRSKLAERMSLPRLTIKIAESSDGECPVTVARARQIQAYLERQGVEFLPVGCEPVARLMRMTPIQLASEA